MQLQKGQHDKMKRKKNSSNTLLAGYTVSHSLKVICSWPVFTPKSFPVLLLPLLVYLRHAQELDLE